ncbi:unnamed protein product [Cuscuta epithymum]|uniref:X8 domain-containing protein n=1 Tax=Cuscuta epithymum TaxID=186058 RepID=A0AAV0CN06_9ASTE|nr:unnamed protein product [Cuscuta epithymum]
MAVFVLFSVLFLALVGLSRGASCVCKAGVGDAQLQKSIDYACGNGADCSAIAQGGACYQPNTLLDHCSYAVNSYYQKKSATGATCDFSGTATIATSSTQSNGICSAGTASGGTSTSTPTNTSPTSGGSTGTGIGTVPGTGAGTGTGSTGTGTGTGIGTGTGTGTGTSTGTGINGNVNPTFGGGVGAGLAPTGGITTTTDGSSAAESHPKSTGFLIALSLVALSFFAFAPPLMASF